MVTRRSMKAAAATITAALALAACSGGTGGSGGQPGSAESFDPEQEVTIDFAWWGDAARAERYEEALDVFAEQYPNITIRMQFQAWGDYWTARNTEGAADSLPDVFMMDMGNANLFGERGQLLDLGTQIDANLDVSTIDADLLANGEFDGTQYAVPIGTNSLSMQYDSALLGEMGIEPPAEGYSWDDYDTFVTEVAEAGSDRNPAVLGATDYTANWQLFQLWLFQQGKAPFGDDGMPAFSEEDVTTWLERGQPLREAGVFTPQDRVVALAPSFAFNQGEEGASLNWGSAMAQNVNDLGDDVQIALPPAGPDGPSMYFTVSMGLAISQGSENPEAAAVFVDFLANDPEVGRIFGTTRGVPASSTQLDGVEAASGSVDESILAYQEQVAAVIGGPAPVAGPETGGLEAEWMRLSEELNYGSLTIPEFVEQWFAYTAGL